MIEQYTREAHDELQHIITEKRESYDQAMLSSVSFYELKKLRAEIVELEKRLEVIAKRLNRDSLFPKSGS